MIDAITLFEAITAIPSLGKKGAKQPRVAKERGRKEDEKRDKLRAKELEELITILRILKKRSTHK